MSHISRPFSQRIRKQGPLIVACGVSFVSIFIVLSYVSNVTRKLTQQAAIANAATISHALREFRTLYTSEVVERVRPYGITVTHDYQQMDASIPLPATLTKLLGDRLSFRGSQGNVRLYSNYPFPWRVNGGPRTDFERYALRELENDPSQPVFKLEESQGRQVLRYATADLMRKSCVACHNTHPDTPKNDWKEGDVRGALAVTIDLEEVAVTSANDVWGLAAILLFMALFGSGGLIFFTAWIGRKAQTQATHALERASAEKENQQLLQALRLVENQQLALDQHAIVSVTDIKGDIIYANDNFCQISGYTREEILGQNHRLIKSDEHSAEFFRELWLTISTGKVWSGTIKNRRKDGSSYWVDATIVPYQNEQGQIEQYVAIRTDISELRFAEERLLEANRELREFNGVVVDRELRMIELKQEVNALADGLGHDPRYDVDDDKTE